MLYSTPKCYAKLEEVSVFLEDAVLKDFERYSASGMGKPLALLARIREYRISLVERQSPEMLMQNLAAVSKAAIDAFLLHSLSCSDEMGTLRIMRQCEGIRTYIRDEIDKLTYEHNQYLCLY